MWGVITKWVDVREGEGVVVAKATATLFGIIAAHTMLETARDALFLTSMAPSALTYVYGILAGLAIVVSRGNSIFVSRFGRRNALIFTLGAAAYGTIVFYLLPASSQLYFAFYLWSGLLGTVMAVQFWMFAGRRFTVAQGKRLFGPLASGGVLGAVMGASASLLILRFSEVQTLLISASVLFVATSMLLTTVASDDVGLAPSSKEKLFANLDYFRKEPYLLRLAILIGLSTATVLTADYMFKAAAASTIAPERLGDFFATYYAILNGVALVVQLLLSAALVRRLGIVTASAILPVLLLAGGVGTVIAGGTFFAVMMAKGADGTLRHSLHRISLELLWMPLSEEVRTRSKVFVDTVVTRGSQALAAGGLLLLASFKLDSTYILGWIVAGLATAWLGYALGLRKLYLELFRNALGGGVAPEANLQLDLRSIEVVTEALSSRDPVRSNAAIDLLAGNGRARLIPALILYHENQEVLLHALEVVATPDRKDWIPLAERLLEHDDEDVRVAALRPVALAGQMAAVQGRLLDISPFVRAHAAFWLAEASDAPPSQRKGVQQIIAMEGTAGQQARVGLLSAVAISGNPRWSDVVITLSTSAEIPVMKSAARAMSRLNDERFVPLLIDRLRYREGRDEIREALRGIGAPALEAMAAALRDHDTDVNLRHHLPRTISRMGTQDAADVLVDQMASEGSGRVRYKILRGLGRMVIDFGVRLDGRAVEGQAKRNLTEYFDLMALHNLVMDDREDESPKAKQAGDLLVGLLADKQKQALDRAFRLLHLLHPRENLRSVAKAAKAKDERTRAQALEFLDALTLDAQDPQIRVLFRLALDDLDNEERVGRAGGLTADLPADRREGLIRLVRGADDALSAVASYYALQLGFPEVQNVVREAANQRKSSVLNSLIESIVPGGLSNAT